MKLILLAAFAALGVAQTRLEVAPQCPGTNQIIVIIAFQAGGITVPLPICVALDPASFSLQTQVSANVATGTLSVKPTAGATTPAFVDGEIPSGAIDGTNVAFTLAAAPNPAGSLHFFRNGLRLSPGSDFTLAGAAVTFLPGAAPQPGDILRVDYRK